MLRTVLLFLIGVVVTVFLVRQFMSGFTGSHAGNIDFNNASAMQQADWMRRTVRTQRGRLIQASKRSISDQSLSWVGERAEAARRRVVVVLRFDKPAELAEPEARHQLRYQGVYCPRFVGSPSSAHRLTYVISHQNPDGSRLIDVEISNAACAGRG